MYKNILLIYIILILTIPAYGQDYIFRVMANKGENMFRLDDKSSWKPVKKGVALNSGYWVKVADDAYLGLLHNTGKTAGLINPGVFEIENIENSIRNKRKGLGAKYTDFVMNNITDQDILDQYDIITRGGKTTIKVFLPIDADVLNTKMIVNWEPLSDEATYLVTVKGIFNDVLFEDETTSVKYHLDIDRKELKDQSTFFVKITSKENEDIHSQDFGINRLSDDEATKYREELQSYENSQLTPLDHTILGGYFEANKLLIDASYHYQRAALLAPDVKDFLNMYEAFILRNRLGN